MIENVLLAYVVLGLIAGVLLIGTFGYEDVTGRYDPKFGPNYKKSLSWFLVLLVSMPILNLAFILSGLYIHLRYVVWKKNANSI